MERPRRIFALCYMNLGVASDCKIKVAFRYHRCISNSR